MQYTVKDLSKLTGLTPRTLRYYDTIGLLCPDRNEDNDYRLYSDADVERLGDILLYREMGFPLEEIGTLLNGSDREALLTVHLERLQKQSERLAGMICIVQSRLAELKGEQVMSGKEKFEAMKDRVLLENEAEYGSEIREKYGAATVESCYSHVSGLSQEQWAQMQRYEAAYLEALRRAAASGDPAGEDAREACRLHLQWLRYTWKPEMCTPQAHRGLVKMYDLDERFRAYYEEHAGVGSAAFFAEAIDCYYSA